MVLAYNADNIPDTNKWTFSISDPNFHIGYCYVDGCDPNTTTAPLILITADSISGQFTVTNNINNLIFSTYGKNWTGVNIVSRSTLDSTSSDTVLASLWSSAVAFSNGTSSYY